MVRISLTNNLNGDPLQCVTYSVHNITLSSLIFIDPWTKDTQHYTEAEEDGMSILVPNP